MSKCSSVLMCAVVLSAILSGATGASAGVEELKIGGRFMWDQVVWGNVDSALGLGQENGTEVRRARVFFQGKVYSKLNFKVNWDFADGEEVALKDAYLELVDIPVVSSMKVGHMNEPFCMNELSSSKYITFLERASITAFAPSRNSGLMLAGGAGDRVLWQAGAFRQTDDLGAGSGDMGVSLGGRVGFMVAGAVKGDRLLHLGASANYLMSEGNVVRFSSRPEIHMSGKPVDTGELSADGVTRTGLEAAAVVGRFHFAGEYAAATVSCTVDSSHARAGGASGSDARFSGFYVQGGCFLTGEHRSFAEGQWQRTSPRTNFLEDGGTGAWEVALRYSSIDLDDADAGIEGGRMDDITAGLNWYLHANARVMLDQVWSTVKDADGGEVGSVTATTMRFQFDF